MNEVKVICEKCGKEHLPSEDVIIGGTHLCSQCADELTVICRCCGRRIWRTDAIDYDLCEYCYEDEYTTCCNCDALIHRDDARYFYDDEDDREYPYCEDCYERRCDKAIHDYYYKPDPIFYGKGSRFFGVELEMDDGGEYEENAESLLRIANAVDEHMYIKHDGSIERGFECVSHPMTLEYHLKHMPWSKILNKAIAKGYRSHQADSCGLHVHINRTSFGESYQEQEGNIAKVLYFYEKFWNEILKFSRRSQQQVNRWARRYGGGLINPKETLKHAKNARLGRYVAVNLENEDTIEMRIFRGTLKYSTFTATLQFVDSICDAAVSLSDEGMQNLTWLDFVQRIPPDKQELIDYLKSRRLYVNEPVITEDEEV